MTLVELAEEILRAAGTPLHYTDLARQALNSGRWHTTSKTPATTVNAQLSADIDKKGTDSAFERVGRGTFGLRSHARAEDATGVGANNHPSDLQSIVSPSTTNKTAALTFTDAAEQVLDRFGERSPMHYAALTERALQLGLIRTTAKTPKVTLYAAVDSEIKRREKRGDAPRFVMHGKGLIGLSRWAERTDQSLATQITQHNHKVRRDLLARLQTMDPAEFEDLVRGLLVAIGFDEVSVTRFSGDGGIDVRGTLVVGDVIRTRMAVQVKRWKNNIQAPTVQQVRGSLSVHEQGLIITTSDFSTGARDEAEKPSAVPVALMNGEQLVALLVEHDIGVQRTSHDLFELDEVASE